jgi:hypothetical protein
VRPASLHPDSSLTLGMTVVSVRELFVAPELEAAKYIEGVTFESFSTY